MESGSPKDILEQTTITPVCDTATTNTNKKSLDSDKEVQRFLEEWMMSREALNLSDQENKTYKDEK